MKKSFPARALPLRCVFRARNLAILLLTLPQGTCCCCCARPSSGASKAVEGAARREQTEDGKTRLADVAPRRGARLPRPRPARSGHAQDRARPARRHRRHPPGGSGPRTSIVAWAVCSLRLIDLALLTNHPTLFASPTMSLPQLEIPGVQTSYWLALFHTQRLGRRQRNLCGDRRRCRSVTAVQLRER